MPFPNVKDFRVEANEETNAELQANAQKTIAEWTAKSAQASIERVFERICTIRDSLIRTPVVRPKLMQSLLDTAALAQSLNITGDNRVGALCKAVQALKGSVIITPDEIPKLLAKFEAMEIYR